MKNTTSLVFAIFAAASMVFGEGHQLLQDRPEYCGTPGVSIPAPPDISILTSVDEQGTENKLFIRGKEIKAPEGMEVAHQICPLSANRYLLFGEVAGGDGTEMDIIDTSKAKITAGMGAWGDPILSPDKRWVAYRMFYPRHMEDTFTEIYILWDLQNAEQHATDWGASKAVYPLGVRLPGGGACVPERYEHRADTNGFYWSTDSKALVFADRLPGKKNSDINIRSIVLVTIGPDGSTSTGVHLWSGADICPKCTSWNISNIVVGPAEGGDRLITVAFGSGVKDLQLHSSDLQPAKPEVYEGQPKWLQSPEQK
jgi:hypothetical protein